jgi:hypothetical protein
MHANFSILFPYSVEARLPISVIIHLLQSSPFLSQVSWFSWYILFVIILHHASYVLLFLPKIPNFLPEILTSLSLSCGTQGVNLPGW